MTSEISTRAARAPSAAIFQAAWRTRSVAASISARLSAIQAWTSCFPASGSPGAISRAAARRQSSSNARSQIPNQRMQWWMRPGPRRAWATAKPLPRPPRTLSGPTRQADSSTSPWLAQPSPAWPMTGTLRTSRKPGVPVGTTNIVARPCGGASGSETAMTTAKAAPSAEEANHLWPSSSQPPPSGRAVVASQTGFDPGSSGSVIAKQLRMPPAASGASHFSFCAGLPCSIRISRLPASGAWQLKA